ncbi:MAG: HDIG domain-containing protein [Chlorobi bacterium]|nr:HDIG domain-containing protein [Chlorobiota bacterium]
MNYIFSKLQDNYYSILKIILFIVAIVAVIWVSPKANMFKYEFSIGTPWNHTDLIAPFDFSIYKTNKQIEEEKEQIIDNFKPYFKYDLQKTEESKAQLNKDFDDAWLANYNNKKDLKRKKYKRILNKILDKVENAGVIQHNSVLEGKDKGSIIRLIKGNQVEEVRLESFYDIRTANEYLFKEIDKLDIDDSTLFKNLLSHSLVQNVFYDEAVSKADMDQLMGKILPTHGLVQKGELIISAGELVNSDKYQILSSLKREYEKEIGTSESKIFIVGGLSLLIVLMFLIEFFYFRIYLSEKYESLKNIVLVLLSQVLLITIADFVFYNYPDFAYVIPYAILPIIVTAFIGSRFAIISHVITILILGFFAPNSFEFFYTQFTAGFIAIFAVKKLDKRADIFRASIYVFVTYMLVYLSMLFVQEGSLDNFSFTFMEYIAGSSILLLLSFPIIFLYEKVFGIITHLSLLELSNTNNPLLMELSQKAPGTFQHSLLVANLASDVLHEIGGDALLARTGAMYHDVGKMNNPLYFIENQGLGGNPHDDLTYEESARIIIGHVLDGIEMARKAGLPEQIIDFIRTHHGTRRVEYFFRLEKRLNPGVEVDKSEFTYHGPAPFSKETAVVMMADSVEAASKSIKQPTEQNINDLVDNIIDDHLANNQFHNANITMKDITIARKVLKKKLLSINHVRIAYPE